jgi:hypothetical protein
MIEISALFLLLSLSASAAADSGPWFQLADSSSFSGSVKEGPGIAFDIVATDMDLDGDTDVLVNWHHLAPMELLINEDARLRSTDVPQLCAAGLVDHPENPPIYATPEHMRQRIAELSLSGLIISHAPNRRGAWSCFWRNIDGRLPALELSLATPTGFRELKGLRPGEYEEASPQLIRVALGADTAERDFHFRTHLIGTQLIVELNKSEEQAIAVFVGPELVAAQSSKLEFWKNDPHGMAWVNVLGSPHPELYVTRGALRGTLQPPLDAKRDRFFEGPGFQLRIGTPSADYGRGRRVECVDVYGDGALELSVANLESAHRLLAVDAESGALRDLAPELGLDLVDAHVQAWADFDRDGRQDLYYLADEGIQILRNLGEGRFELVDAAVTGLVLPPAKSEQAGLDATGIRFADFDADGRLDLWLLVYGRARGNFLFRKSVDGYEDWTAQLGLHTQRWVDRVVLADFDNDGFEDALAFGRTTTLWHNVEGKAIEFISLESKLVGNHQIQAASVLDVDGDGRIDVIAASEELYLLWNRREHANSFLRLLLEDSPEPIGALVTAHYRSGRQVIRRYGSANSSAHSQSLQPLHFGVPEGDRIEDFVVLWPNELTEQSYEAPAPGSAATLSP